MATAAAHDHIKAVNIRAGACFEVCFKVHQLVGNILAAVGNCLGRHIGDVFPVTICRLGVGGCRRGVSDTGSRYHPGGLASKFRQLRQCHQLVTRGRTTIAPANVFVHAKHAYIGFYTRHHGCHCASGVGHLRIYVISFGQAGERKTLEAQLMLFPRLALILAIQNTRRCDG